MRVAIVTPEVQDSKRLFGAERHFVGMAQAFRQKVDTDWIQVPVSEVTWEAVLQSYIDCCELDLSFYDLVISTKNPTFMAQHPNHVCWLLHQIRVFYDRFDDEYATLAPPALAEKRRQRETIQQLDKLAFRRVRKIFTNGHETARRLKQFSGYTAEVLHPPVLAQGHYCRNQNYFLLPGRLHRWKRVDLALQAMKRLPEDIQLLIPGSGEDEEYFRKMAGNDSRIHFLGFVSDSELLDLYADALAVLFLPKEEDYGYITIEGMLSHKPVIVCTDSGEPARLVQNGRTGFVVDPDPVEIAAAMALLAGDRKLAMDMGEIAFGSTSPQLWSEVVDRILEAGKPLPRDLTATKPAPLLQKNEIPVLVADNQVLDPPIGGGRVRIHELYRHVARLGFEVCYVGAFDWPGPAYRDQMIASHFREVITPLTQPHFARNRHFERATGGKTTIDVTMPELLKYSPRFQRMTAEHGRDAKAIIVSHPWVYPYVSRRANQKLIYDSHNCEVYAKQQILGDTAAGRKLVAEVGKLEAKLCAEADLIFVCSQDDTDQFKQRYGISPQKFVLVPNGVDVRDVYPANASTRQRARSEFGLDNNNPVLIFIGSGYSPNVEAAEFLVKELASALPHYKIVIAGSVRDSCAASNRVPSPPNVIWTGTLDNRQRLALYHAADIALNPMFSGSGTNLKMLDYFASGLPVISTPIGARGLAIDTENCVVCPARDFVSNVKVLARDTALRARLGRTARELAERNYDWAVIAADAANALLTLLETESVHAA